MTTRGPTQIDESRVKTRFGNGSMTKSVPRCMRRTSEPSGRASEGSSSNVIPAVSTSASLAGSRPRKIGRKLLRQRRSQALGIDRGRDALHPGRAAGQHASFSKSDSNSTSTPREREQFGELVVLLLRPRDPGQSVEQQIVVVARRESAQLGTGPVHDHHPQRTHFGVRAQPAASHI